jgi:ATP-dependent DNA helicase PIF1
MPVFKVLADHSDKIAERADASDANQLESYLELSIGCKLMILENIWTERGIVNGTQCRLFDIVWPEDSDPCKEQPDQPLCILIGIPISIYTGPSVQEYLWNDEPYAVVPVYRSQREFWLEGAVRHRSQFPIRLAYAITVHKAQGMTMPKVVLNFTHSRKDLGVAYVAASRVRRLEDIMFEESFDFERVTSAETGLSIMRSMDWDRRAVQRHIASNQTSTAEQCRRGPSHLSHSVLRIA